MSCDSLDLRAHFALRALPFTRELPVEQRWTLSQYDDAGRALLAFVQRRMSDALIAPAGTGETVVLRTLRCLLPEARYRVHHVKVAALFRRDFTRELCRVVQISPAGHHNTLVERFQERASELFDHDGVRPMLLIDEAPDMRPEVLTSIRFLANLVMDSRGVLSVFLCGQGALHQVLQRPDLEAVSRRLTHVATLKFLSGPETADYVAHRPASVGGNPGLIASHSLDAVHEISGGNLRATDRLAHRVLELAAAAGGSSVAVEHVVTARQALLP